MAEPALTVRGLTVDHGAHRAVDSVDFDVAAGTGHALVGRSGAGKTTVARAVVRLVEPTAGRIVIGGQEIQGLSGRALRRARRTIQMIFQDPQTSLDPRWRIRRSVAEPLRARGGSRAEQERTVASLLERVGLTVAHAARYPHELSIGQQQRVAIARALAPDPSVLVCDEPMAALDVSVQAQILNLLRELKAERSLAVLLVTHDLAVAAQLCETMSVIDDGHTVRSGATTDVLRDPQHERAVTLVAAARRLDPTPPSPLA